MQLIVASVLSDITSSDEAKQTQGVHALLEMVRTPKRDSSSNAASKFRELDGFATLLQFMRAKLVPAEGDLTRHRLLGYCMEAVSALVRDSKACRYGSGAHSSCTGVVKK